MFQICKCVFIIYNNKILWESHKTFSGGMESPSGGEDTSGVDSVSPPLTEYSKKQLLMMPPEEKLQYFDSLAQAQAENKEYDACIKDLIRCLALVKLVYGDGHLRLAQAHARLAKAYFQFKGWGVQAIEHASSAREILRFCSADKREVLQCLLSLSLTQGGAALLTDNLDEAECAYLKAEDVVGQLFHRRGLSQEDKLQTELDIFTGLTKVYRRQGKAKEALCQCEKSLQLLKDCGRPEKSCSVYRDMADIEQDQGHLDRAIEHLTKAHTTAVSQGPEELEGARVSHSLALVLSGSAQQEHNDSAGDYFEQSLSIYRKCVSEQNPAFLTAQDDYCRYLLLRGEQERCVQIQRASLPSKRSVYGDLSAEVADTLQLIGSVEMTKGKLTQAYKTMRKCLEIQSLHYGPQHKKTKATQKAVDMLARTPEVAQRLQRKPLSSSSVVSVCDKDRNSVSEF